MIGAGPTQGQHLVSAMLLSKGSAVARMYPARLATASLVARVAWTLRR